MKRLPMLLFLLLLNFTQQFFAQTQGDTRERLAAQFYDNREFDKAADLYEALYRESGASNHYTGYYRSMFELKKFESLEKFLKKQIKSDPQKFEYRVDLGMVYKELGEASKSKKIFDEATEMVSYDQSRIIQLAGYYTTNKLYSEAIACYEYGEKSMQGIYPFSFEKAQVYLAMGDFAGAVGQYLSAIEVNEGYQNQVQNILQGAVAGEDADSERSEIIRKQLLKKIQSKPDNTAFAEMLIWFQIQQRDFEGAFIQSKALDRRLNEKSSKIITLASVCMSNMEYDLAIRCYEYEIAKGPFGQFYAYARMELLKALDKKITSGISISANELEQLEGSYKKALNELGESAQTLSLMRGYAHLKAFYQNNPTEAFELLERALGFGGNDPKIIAECKLEMGDVLLFTGDVWECSLLYSQVEKDYKNEPIGHEAKFRNARLSFYKGEFEWAQAQLDVLKSATSKLIANDALNLSLLILDNVPDSDYVPLSYYARADLLMYRNLDSLALLTLDSLNSSFLNHPLNDDVLMLRYKVAMKRKDHEKAIGILEKILTQHGSELLGDDACFALAELQEMQLNNKEKAKTNYQRILTEYPGSLYTVEARKRYRRLRGDSIN